MRAGRATADRLAALTSLRFFAAAYVVVYHWRAFVWPEGPRAFVKLVECGFSAVALFFMLSGFVLTYAYGERLARGETRLRAFWAARFARVYPLYLLALLWGMWSYATYYGLGFRQMLPAHLLAAATLQAWIPELAWQSNVPGWSISCESFFYLMFPLIAARLVRAGRRAAWGVLVGSWLVSFLPWAVSVAMHQEEAGFFRIGPLCRLPELVMGCALGRLFVLERTAGVTRGGGALALLGACGFVVLTQVNAVCPFVLLHGALPAPFHAAVIYGLARGGRVSDLLAVRPLRYLGEVSYAVYILQEPVALTVASRWPLRGAWSAVWTSHVAYWAVLLFVSVVAHHVVERPLRDVLGARLSGARPKIRRDGVLATS